MVVKLKADYTPGPVYDTILITFVYFIYLFFLMTDSTRGC